MGLRNLLFRPTGVTRGPLLFGVYMKILSFILMSVFAIGAQADLIRPGGNDFKNVSTLRCYLDTNQNGNISKSEILFQADPATQSIVDVKGKINYTVARAVVTKTPNGRTARIEVSAVARGLAFAGGGSQSLKIETDFFNRARWNSTVSVTTTTFYDGSNTKAEMMDCDLQELPTAGAR